jgi:hypothetical protein
MSGTVHSLVDHWILPLSVPFTVWCASSLCLSQSTHGILGTQDAHMVWHYPKQLWEIESGYMERVKNCNFPLLCPDLVFLLPLPIPKLTRSGVPTQEILDGTGSTSTFPQFILGLGLWLGSDKLSCGIEGHFPRAGLLPGFQKDQRIRLEVFLLFFFPPRRWISNWNLMSGFSELQSMVRHISSSQVWSSGGLLTPD